MKLPSQSTSIPTLLVKTPKRVPGWRFWLPLLLQIGLIVSIPARALHTHIVGTTVILQTIPVDPYDLLRGYSQTLRYDISNIDTLNVLPGWDEIARQVNGSSSSLPDGTRLYVILETPPAQSRSLPPQPWKAVAVSLDRPEELAPNQVALRGQANGSWISYGLETYYFPEDRRHELNANIARTQGLETQPFVVEVKIDRQGQSVPISLWVRDRRYQF